MLDILYLPFWSSLWPSPPCSNCIRPTLTVYINWLVCPLTLAWVQPVESTSRRSKRSRRNYTSGQDEVKEIIFNSHLKKLMNYTNTLKMQYQLLDIRWYRTVIPEREKTSWNLKFPSLLPREFPACMQEVEIFLCWGDGCGKQGRPRQLEKTAAQREFVLGIYRGFLWSL